MFGAVVDNRISYGIAEVLVVEFISESVGFDEAKASRGYFVIGNVARNVPQVQPGSVDFEGFGIDIGP
jgi:hypothetical protein